MAIPISRNRLHPSRSRRGAVSMARRVIGAILAGVVIYGLYVVQSGQVGYYQISGSSMEPTYQAGDRLVMLSSDRYEVGDVVVASQPGQPRTRLAKRIVAAGPSTVAIRRGQLFVDGRPSPPPQGISEPVDLPTRSWQLSPGAYFVVGGHRAGSYDSRDFGPVAATDIHGILHPLTHEAGNNTAVASGR